MSSFDLEIETTLDEFSEHLDKNIDVPRLLDLCARACEYCIEPLLTLILGA